MSCSGLYRLIIAEITNREQRIIEQKDFIDPVLAFAELDKKIAELEIDKGYSCSDNGSNLDQTCIKGSKKLRITLKVIE